MNFQNVFMTNFKLPEWTRVIGYVSSLNSVVKALLSCCQKQRSCLTVAILGFLPASFTGKYIFLFTPSLI